MTRPIAVLMLCFSTAGAAGGRPAIASPLPVTAPGPGLTLLEQETGAQPPATGPGRVVVTIAVEGLRIPAVRVELRNFDGNIVVGQTISDTVGQVTFPDIPAGRYVVRAVREGFADAESVPFTVRGGATEQVLVDMRLTFVRESVDVVVPANSPTESLQPVAVSDVLSGTKMDIQPLAGDDFQSLLTLLPSIIRGPEGRLRIKGGAATTGALQVSSASLNDPSTGDFDLELPSGAVESVEVLSNPFAAEYGRFSTSVTQVRTKRGTNEWVFKPDNLVPGFGKGFAFVNKFEPRLSISGPLKRDKLLLGQYMQYRFARTKVKSLPDEPQLGLDSFDSFTRLDAVLSSRHALTGGVIYFPRKITNATLSTFRPPETTPKFSQEGFSTGLVDRLILSAHAVLESTFAARFFEVDLKSQGTAPMVYAPQGQSGNFFNAQQRDVRSVQLIEALTISKDKWAGDHVFKIGLDLQQSSFEGESYSQQLDVRRLDGSLAERTTYAPSLALSEVTGTEFAMFVQDRWRVNDRLAFELGFRTDRDDVVERVNFSPRVGMSVSLLPEGRGILRAGFGKFSERTPLTVGAFTQYEEQTIARFAPDGSPLGRCHQVRACCRWRVEDPGKHRADGGLGSALRAELLLQGRLPQSQRLARVHPEPGSDPRAALAVFDRRVEVLGVRGHRPISRERAPRHHRVLRPLAQHPRPQRLRSVLRELQESDREGERVFAQSDGRSQSPHRARLDWPARQVGVLAGLRVAHGLPVVDGGRIPGLRRHPERVGTAADAVLARLHARPADSLQEVPLHRRDQDLQRLRLGERARRPDQHRVARLRLVLQPDSALDWVRHLIGPVGLRISQPHGRGANVRR